MKQHLFTSIRITLAFLVLTCAVYPAAVWAVAQLAFRDAANGSLLTRDNRVIGSALIGQQFVGARFFHPRPSASNYDATTSGGSNLGPTSRKLAEQIAERTKAFGGDKVPVDAVTASASGLDPHISPENAMAQAPRVARANHVPLVRVQSLIRARTEGRFLGIFGEPRVNVLLLNLDLPGGQAILPVHVSARTGRIACPHPEGSGRPSRTCFRRWPRAIAVRKRTAAN
jgi:K+-transporting ATPase ATPase C chain